MSTLSDAIQAFKEGNKKQEAKEAILTLDREKKRRKEIRQQHLVSLTCVLAQKDDFSPISASITTAEQILNRIETM